jgi:hypothetical protein
VRKDGSEGKESERKEVKGRKEGRKEGKEEGKRGTGRRRTCSATVRLKA